MNFPKKPTGNFEGKSNETKSITILPGGFFSKLNRMVFAVSTDDLRPAMNGIHFHIFDNEAKMAATDGHRIVIDYQAVEHQENFEFILNKSSVNLVLNTLNETKPIEVNVNGSQAMIKQENITLFCRIIDERYPQYEAILKEIEPKIYMEVNRKELMKALTRAKPFSNSITNQIVFDIDVSRNVKCRFSVENLDYDFEYSEEFDSELLPCPDKEIFIGFNLTFLIQNLKNMLSDNVIFGFTQANRAAIMKPQSDEDKQFMLLMPVMLNRYE